MEALPVAALWGVSVVAQKYSLGSLKPSTSFIIIPLLYATFILCYLVYNWKAFNDDIGNVSRRLSIVLLAGVFASFIANIKYYKTLQTNSAPVVSTVISTVPLFVALLSFILLGTKLTQKQILGILFVVFGINLLH